jgi:hypothetical protein
VREEGEKWSAGRCTRPDADSRRDKLCRRFQSSGKLEWRAIGSQACAPLFPLRDEQFRSSLGYRVRPLQGRRQRLRFSVLSVTSCDIVIPFLDFCLSWGPACYPPRNQICVPRGTAVQ